MSIKAQLRSVVPGIFVLAKGLGLLYSPRSLLRTSGYVRSVATGKPCRGDGEPIPWMNYGVIAFLESRLRPDLTLFEFGSGHSTLFFARRVKQVVSVECNPGWYEHVRRSLPDNVSLILAEATDTAGYVGTLAAQGTRFDVIVVDAMEREACLDVADRWLTDGGVILLDDSSRPRYAAAMDALAGRGFRRLDFEGLKPGGIRAYRTTLFYRPGNVLGL